MKKLPLAIEQPLWVIDWNFVQSHTRASNLPARGQYVLIDQMFQEIIDKDKSPQREAFLHRLPRFFENRQRLWFGRNRIDLFSRERKSDKQLALGDVLRKDMTRLLRKSLVDSDFDWRTALKQGRAGRGLALGIESKARFMDEVSDLEVFFTNG